MAFAVTINEYRLVDGVAYLDVSTPTLPGLVAEIDATDLPRALDGKARWHAYRGHSGLLVARSVTIAKCKRASEMLHRHILSLPRARFPSVLHRDDNRLNCRRTNMVIVDRTTIGGHARQHMGRKKYKGVFRREESGRYRAMIQVRGDLMRLGTFVHAIDAARAYDAAAREHFGEFARVNFPE